MRAISITVSRDSAGQFVFVFDDGPGSFITLAVVSEQGDTMWEVHPASTQPSCDGVGVFVSVRLPQALGTLFQGMAKSDEDLMSQFAPVACVTYGAVPAGYEAAAPAVRLDANTKYRIIVLRDAEYGTADFRV
jgi:hypothetical protein